MDRLRRAAVLTRLIKELRDQGSWCGETHVQKAAYFLRQLMKVPLDLDFILYKHGPFSFDLRDELTALRADGLIGLEPQWPYGPQIVLTDRSEYIQGLFRDTLKKYAGCISFVAKKLGGKDVSELERLATALFVSGHAQADASIEERAEEITRLKPHISLETAMNAVKDVDRISEEARTRLK